MSAVAEPIPAPKLPYGPLMTRLLRPLQRRVSRPEPGFHGAAHPGSPGLAGRQSADRLRDAPPNPRPPLRPAPGGTARLRRPGRTCLIASPATASRRPGTGTCSPIPRSRRCSRRNGSAAGRSRSRIQPSGLARTAPSSAASASSAGRSWRTFVASTTRRCWPGIGPYLPVIRVSPLEGEGTPRRRSVRSRRRRLEVRLGGEPVARLPYLRSPSAWPSHRPAAFRRT